MRRQSTLERFMDKVYAEPNTGCWLWGAQVVHGYGRFKVKGRNQQAHRFAYTLFRGPIPSGCQVLHRCDVPSCVNPDHFWLGDNIDNRRDSVRKKRHPFGRRCHSARLNPAAVRVIRAARDHLPQGELAEAFGVSSVAISKVQLRKTWKHV